MTAPVAGGPAPSDDSLLASVASHYDELDEFYRRLWGEHIHHGLWVSGKERKDEAVLQLLELIAQRAQIRDGDSICDVGCGYGATGRWLWQRYHAVVTGYTVSPVQWAHATQQQPPPHRYVLADWLHNQEADATFDNVIAIESTEHMTDRSLAAFQAHRVLRPGGRFLVATWLSKPRVRPWQSRFLLDPICREALLACRLPTEEDWRSTLSRTGFIRVTGDSVGRAVRRTWSINAITVLTELTQRSGWHYLLDATKHHRRFAITVFRIWLAYRLAAMDYGVVVGQKPG